MPSDLTSLPHGDRLLGRVLLRAVTSPVSLFLATLGLLLVGSPETWAVGAGALALDLGWVWWRVRDPEFARSSGEEMLRMRWRELISRLEQLTTVLDQETASALSGIVEAQERLLGMYGSERLVLPHTRVELTALLQHCLSLAEKKRQIQTYLATFRSHEAQREVNRLQARLEQSRDPATQQLYDQALQQKRKELENYVRLEEAIHRIDGQLSVVRCTFDHMLSQVARMQTADEVNQATSADPVFDEINQLSHRVAELEASLNETLVARGAS
jgi:chromosome segregation ATPase